MLTISGYLITQELHESNNSLIYRGRRPADNQPVIVKMLKQAYPSPEKVAWFKREYEITRSLRAEGIVEVYSLESDSNRPVIILEDFGGESLKQLMKSQLFPLAEFLPLAIQITDSLSQVHQHQIIHKDINPYNIVLNPITGQIKIIDFGISAVLDRENQTLRNPNVLEGTIAYIAPEQTGRMNRAIDYRSDFYSLGVTFYELLIGQLPFETDDAMEVVHSHLAKLPVPPHTINPDIPQQLSKIVLKLMAKNAEDRYQSAFGLHADLEECYKQWQTLGRIDTFPIGQQDFSDKFQISQRLYGREQEIATLLSAFDRVSGNINQAENYPASSRSEMMLVAGYSGIGKSALVQEIYKPITREHGYFISGKFDQFQRDIPYASLVQAFRSLISQLLTESEAEIALWREKLQQALGNNGQLIIDVIPELELIIGLQPALPELAPAEAQNRFNLVFQNFIRVFAQSEHPLALFLDDLQWADGASLKLIQLLMSATDSQYLFVIGAYRDNEVSAAHPLMLTIDEIRQSQGIVNQITLTPLDLHNINQLIADTLKSPLETVTPLAELVLAKTNGNPFFISEFLKSLYSEQLLNFDLSRRNWQWDLPQIQGRNITDNVVELMTGKVQKLEEKTQNVLKLAACIGNQFNLQTLAIVCEKSPRETAADLWQAMAENLILPMSDGYKLIELDVQGLAEEIAVDYKFGHDRIQQAVYFLIPEAEKQAVHWRVGQLLLRNTPTEKQEQKIFEIVNQLNKGRVLINHQTERTELAQLNLTAGKKAKASAAYQSALNYLQVGFNLLGKDSWEQNYNLTLTLYVEAAEAAYLSGDYEQMEQLSEVVRNCAKTVLEKVKVYEVNIRAYANRHKLLEAVKTGQEILEELGISLSENPSPSDIGQALEDTKAAWAEKRIEDLIDLPEMTDPEKLVAIGIITEILHPAYDGFPGLFTLGALEIVKLSVKYGNTPLSAHGYASYATVLCGIMLDIDAGYQFGKLALNLVERFNAKKIKSVVLLFVNYFVVNRKHHLRETLKPFLEGYQIGLETGDLQYAASNAYIYPYHLYMMGKKLVEVESEIAKYSQAIAQIQQKQILNYHCRYWQVVLNLMGRAENPCLLIGEVYNEKKMLPIIVEGKDRFSMCDLHLNKLVLNYLFQNYPQAVENATITEQYLDGIVAMTAVAVFYFYDSLARLAVFPNAPESEQEAILLKVTANQEKMKMWADHAPMNYLHKFYLVEAERDRILGQNTSAREYYDQAISLARENEYLNEEALAYELAARFYLSRQQNHIAAHYFQDAHYTYQQWGATAKVKDLESRYPQFLTVTKFVTKNTTKITSTSGGSSGEGLDLGTVVKASQAIAGEIMLDKLLAKLMLLAIENAGAQTGFLLLSDKDKLKIEAACGVDKDVQVLQSLPVNTSENLPIAIINYVARTQENVVLNDATHEGIFTNDAYITRTQPKSVLCAPILNQGKLTGILYLENNIAIGAFTSERLEVVKILSSQASISIENALLYRTLEQKVEERTVQLAQANREITNLNERLKADNIRMSAELDVTRRLQQMILPKQEELESIEGLEIAGFMEPADEVGGDYYDVLNCEGRVKIGIGDVTGHGLESGVLMIMAQTAVRTLLENNETDSKKFLDAVNRTIYKNANRMNSDKNMTLAMLDYTNGVLTLSGQHEEMIVVCSSGKVERINTVDLGFPVGLVEDIADFVASTEVRLNSGDVVVLYTDGITEAIDINEVQYGLKRLVEVVTENRERTVEEIKQAVIDDIKRHIGEQKVYDDITILVMKQK